MSSFAQGLWNIAVGAWTTIEQMSLYLLFGFLMAGILYVLIPASLVEKHLSGRGILPLLKSTVLGIPLPLCSCGVIPVAASIRKHGAGKGATTAFLLSTPQTGIDSIFVTLSLLGPVFAVARPLTALVAGLFGGTLASVFDTGKKENTSSTSCSDGCCTTGRDQATTCTDECCNASAATGRSRFARVFHYGFVTLPKDIGKPLLWGIVAAGVISAFVPGDFFAHTLGTGIVSMIAMMILGIPVYVCATASVPVAAALMTKGVSAGAALVFLATGPATNAATITTIWKIMGRRTAVIYLAAVAVTSLAAGLVLDHFFHPGEISAAASTHEMIPDYINTGAAVILLIVTGAAMFRLGNQNLTD